MSNTFPRADACPACGHRAHPETPLECGWCPEGYCETGIGPHEPGCRCEGCYAELQAESLVAADVDWDAREMSD